MKMTRYIPFICFFLIFYAILWRVELLYNSDDTAHFEMLDKLGISGWTLWRAETWQPRLFSDLFYARFIYHLDVWKVVNALIAAALPFGLWRTALGPDFLPELEKDTRNRALLLAASVICLLFFFIYPNTVTASSLWYTGSFNYLWPVTALIFGLTPFVFLLRGGNPYPQKVWIPIGIAASLCASFTEQTAAVSLSVSALILLLCLYKKRTIPKAVLIHFAFIAVSAAYYLHGLLTSPRMNDASEIALFPEYATFGLRDKLQLGIHIYDSHLLRSSTLLFFTLALAAGILACLRLKGKIPALRILPFLPAFYALLNIVQFRYLLSGTWLYPRDYAKDIGMPSAFDPNPAEIFDFLYDVPPLGWGLEPRNLFIGWFGFAVVLSMLYPLFFAFRKKMTGLLAGLLYLAAYGSGAVMGFSPTVFASGARPYFLANILLLLLCAMLLREGMTDREPRISENALGKTIRSKAAVSVIAIISVSAIFLYLFYYSAPGYWWF